MNDEAAFLEQLRYEPGDDTTRLVYADWLDERNDPRAEYIRLRQQQAQLTARLNELSAQFDPAWLAAVGGPATAADSFRLYSGRDVRLRGLRQWDLDEGFFGLSDGDLFAYRHQRVEWIVASERERWGEHAPVVIPPAHRGMQTPTRLPSEFTAEVWQEIPSVACVGRFTSFGGAKDKGRRASQLVLMWFQEEFDFLIDPAVREQIRALDWDQHASDAEAWWAGM